MFKKIAAAFSCCVALAGRLDGSTFASTWLVELLYPISGRRAERTDP